MATDDFDTTVEQLYAGPPDQFIARRDAAAKEARAAGDKDLADRIKQLRRSTVAAALVNALQRRKDDQGLADLLDLGERLREAQSTLDVKAMKSLSAERNSLIADLVQQIVDATDEPVSDTVRDQLSDTFTAAVADAEAARAVSSGCLVSSLRYSGFGEVDLSDAVAAPLPSETAPAADHSDDNTSHADEDTAEATQQREDAAEEKRRAIQQRLDDARAALSKAQNAEDAALRSAELAERALKAARQTAKRAQTRAKEATAARSAAQDAVGEAEATES